MNKPKELGQLLISLSYPYADEDWLDPREAFEVGLSDCRQRLPLVLEQWRALRAGAVTEADFQAFGRRLKLAWSDPPEGTSHRRWAEWAESRLVEAIERPDTVLPPGTCIFEPRLLRAGEFHDPSTEQLLVHDLVLRCEAEVGAWLADPDGGLRLHLVADVGYRLGVSTVLDEDTGEVVARRPTSRGAVVLLRTPDDPELPVRAIAAYPVDHEEPGWAEAHRRRWPVLSQVFGGYFGQHGAQWTYPWASQREMLMDEPPAFLDAARAALSQLLALPEPGLRTALTALGCYVEPPHPRSWVERMRWRMEAFDWR